VATVIVPAHNEENVIEKCLNSLINQEGVDAIIVACNGCSDSTASLVKSKYPNVICLDIQKPSKVNALNEAEKLIKSWPVFYIDADVSLSDNAVSQISKYMSENDIHLAAPEPVIDTSESPWLVKQYYETWLKLPYIKEGVIATCSFVISEEGRKRFTQFPDVIADDYFVRSQFYENELTNVPGCKVYVSAPKTLWSLIKIKTRSKLGVMEVKARGLGLEKPAPNYPSIMSSLLFSRHFISTSIYVALVLLFKFRAKKQFKDLDSYEWEMDRSSR